MGDLEAMGRAFDMVLAKDPMFENRAQMATGYFKLAQYIADRNPETARQASIRAQRLSSDASLKNQARSLLMTLRAAENARRGVVDTNRLERAVELDPENRRASELLANARPGAAQAHGSTLRWISSAVIGCFGLTAVLVVLLRRGKQNPMATAALTGDLNYSGEDHE